MWHIKLAKWFVRSRNSLLCPWSVIKSKAINRGLDCKQQWGNPLNVMLNGDRIRHEMYVVWDEFLESKMGWTSDQAESHFLLLVRRLKLYVVERLFSYLMLNMLFKDFWALTYGPHCNPINGFIKLLIKVAHHLYSFQSFDSWFSFIAI